MIPPRIPENEPKRLTALRAMGVLDGPIEERFDRVTRLLARLFDVPIAVVSLVDSDREWFKSCHGVSQREGGRDVSFCGHTILGEDVLLVPDARKDPRFADNPQVTGPMKIRFYAGCPLKASDGNRVGALCIKDRRPRQLTADQVQLLKDCAGWVETELCNHNKSGNGVGGQAQSAISHTDASFQMINALQQANEKLRAASQLKDDFVAKVSHELRTPLTSIKEGLSLMLDNALGAVTAEQQDFLKTMDQEINRLTELINNMLDIAKIESGRMRLNRKALDLQELIATLARTYQPLAGKRKIQLSLDQVPLVFADANRMRQVLTNLLSNAIKFTKEDGTITFRTSQNDGQVSIVVEDDGIGIAFEDLPKLFKKFSQVGAHGRVESKGSGLGLTVSKELVELHKGTIAISSKLGQGTSFTITLPVYGAEWACEELIKELAESESGQAHSVGLIAIRTPGPAGDGAAEAIQPESIQSFEELVRAHIQRSDAVITFEPRWVVVLAATSPDGVRAMAKRLKQLLPNGERLIMGAAMYFDGAVDAKRLLAEAASAQGVQFLR